MPEYSLDPMRTFLLIPILLLLSFTSFSQEKIVDIQIPVASEGMFIPLDTSGFFAIEKTRIVATNQMVKKGITTIKILNW